MAILTLELAVPDLRVPRWNPCGALSGLKITCGATPSSQYIKMCGVASHTKEIWLCPIHAAIVACGGAICQDCAVNGGTVLVRVFRVNYTPLRIPLDAKGVIRGRQ